MTIGFFFRIKTRDHHTDHVPLSKVTLYFGSFIPTLFDRIHSQLNSRLLLLVGFKHRPLPVKYTEKKSKMGMMRRSQRVLLSSRWHCFVQMVSIVILIPSGYCSNDTFTCFTDRDELKAAVDIYLSSSSSSDVDRDNVKSVYGDRIGDWCIDGINDFTGLFQGAEDFNEPLSGWNVSTVTSLAHTFDGCTGFNQPLGHWETDRVTDFSYAFAGATTFHQDLSTWQTSAATKFRGMFQGCSKFTSDLSRW